MGDKPVLSAVTTLIHRNAPAWKDISLAERVTPPSARAPPNDGENCEACEAEARYAENSHEQGQQLPRLQNIVQANGNEREQHEEAADSHEKALAMAVR